MKRSMILTAALSAIILCGCGSETEFTGKTETSAATCSEQLTQLSETEKEIIEPKDKTKFIFGGETETSAAESEAVPEPITEYPAEGVSYKIFNYSALDPAEDNGWSYNNLFFKDGILCLNYLMSSSDVAYSEEYQLRFYNTEENKFLAAVDIPKGWRIDERLPAAEDGELCRFALYHYIYSEDGDSVREIEQSVLTVRNDFSSDITGGLTANDRAVSVCGHNVTDWENDVIDADSGRVLVEGYDGASEYDLYATSQRYMFPIDENRFVYYTAGYERIPGFGIYDFSAGTATDVPNSNSLFPIGIHSGKVYSLKTEWDSFGCGDTIFVTDTETLETELFMENPVSAGTSYNADYEMSEGGGLIVMKCDPDDENLPAQIYLIDTDTKELTVCDIPEEFRRCGMSQADRGELIIFNRKDKALIIETDR